MEEKDVREWMAIFRAWLWEYPQRAAGLGLFVVGCVLAGAARAGGGDPFQDLALGLLMGLGVGCMALGAVFLALSLRCRQ